jgi:hypothetical protein
MESALSLWTSTPAQLFGRYSEVLGRRRRIGTPHPEEIRSFFMEQTAAGFSCLSGAFGVRPWQALSFIAWLNAPAQQVDPAVQAAGRFLLSVWGPKTDWRAQGLAGWRPFDLTEALDVWSTVDRQAFERWLDAPVWP